MTDGASRYLLLCEGLPHCREQLVRHHLELTFREFGLPSRIRSDNGSPFASVAPGGLSALSVWWIKLGILPERIEPGHPEQNGRHERMHRTLKAEATKPSSDSFIAQQLRFDLFRREYNEVRPHEALGQVPPAKHYEPAPRAYPSELSSPKYKGGVVRWPWKGFVKWRGGRMPLGPQLDAEPVAFVQANDWCWELFYGPIRLGYVDDRDKTLNLRTQAVPPIHLDSSKGDNANTNRHLLPRTPYTIRKHNQTPDSVT